jgi:hypothetical protein
MTQLASDTFQRANENPLSGGGVWTSPIHSEHALQIVSNLCEGSVASVLSSAFYSGVVWPNDQYSEVTIAATRNTVLVGSAVRCSASTETYYVGWSGGAALFLYVENAGVLTALSSNSTNTGIGGVVKTQALGSTISVFYNGISQLSVTDSTIVSGSAGISVQPDLTIAHAQISTWDGGNFSGTAAISGNVGGTAGSGALVLLTSDRGDIVSLAICDASGNYTFSNLPDLRTYILSATISGSVCRVQHSVTLAGASVTNVNFQLSALNSSNTGPLGF